MSDLEADTDEAEVFMLDTRVFQSQVQDVLSGMSQTDTKEKKTGRKVKKQLSAIDMC